MADERGFTIVEIMVVLLIVALLMAIALPTLNRTRKNMEAPNLNAGAGAIWRGIQNYRMENHGELPTTAMLTSASGDAFKDVGNEKYVRKWPTSNDGEPLVVRASSTATPPSSVSSTSNLAGRLLYYAGSSTPSSTGWLVAYAPSGKMIFRRTLDADPATQPPPLG